MQNKLDDANQIQTIDKQNMAGHILDLPNQIVTSLKKAKEIHLPQSYHSFDNVCLVGMGGSATAADILVNQSLKDIKKPTAVLRQMELPGWVDENSLVVLISHSGETKEILEAFKDASSREAKIIAIAERGKLQEMGEIEKAVIFDYDTEACPRASLGYQFGYLTHISNELGLLPEIKLEEATALMQKVNQQLKPGSPTEENIAKHLAFCVYDHQPIILASGILKSISRRWKNQFNENAKSFTSFDSLPEAMHNSIEGTSFPARAKGDNFYILLKNSFNNPFIDMRFNAWANVLDNKKIQYEIIEAKGQGIWSQKFSLVLLGDWVSYYLAILNNTDPTPVPTIEGCKQGLRR